MAIKVDRRFVFFALVAMADDGRSRSGSGNTHRPRRCSNRVAERSVFAMGRAVRGGGA